MRETRPGWPPIEIVTHWNDLNEHLFELVDLVPDGELDWSPGEADWGCRRLFLHIASARHHWLNESLRDGNHVDDLEQPGVGGTRQELQDHLRTSWDRLRDFLVSQAHLDATYAPPEGDPWYVDPDHFDGHFIAFHRLVHDAHHRADIIRLLTLLDVKLPPERRRRPL